MRAVLRGMLPLVLAVSLVPAAPLGAQTVAAPFAPELIAAAVEHAVVAQAPAAPPAAPAGMIIERVRHATYVAPDVKFGQVNGRTSTFVGATAGVALEERLFIGGAGYWLVNDAPDREMWYLGVVGGWHFPAIGPLSLSLTTLAGGGYATLSQTFTISIPDAGRRPGMIGGVGTPGIASYKVFVPLDFLIAEPTATATLRLTRAVAVFGSVGYRWVGQAGSFNDELGGVSGAVGIRFGR